MRRALWRNQVKKLQPFTFQLEGQCWNPLYRSHPWLGEAEANPAATGSPNDEHHRKLSSPSTLHG